jgi:hypothetical protein
MKRESEGKQRKTGRKPESGIDALARLACSMRWQRRNVLFVALAG